MVEPQEVAERHLFEAKTLLARPRHPTSRVVAGQCLFGLAYHPCRAIANAARQTLADNDMLIVHTTGGVA